MEEDCKVRPSGHKLTGVFAGHREGFRNLFRRHQNIVYLVQRDLVKGDAEEGSGRELNEKLQQLLLRRYGVKVNEQFGKEARGRHLIRTVQMHEQVFEFGHKVTFNGFYGVHGATVQARS